MRRRIKRAALGTAGAVVAGFVAVVIHYQVKRDLSAGLLGELAEYAAAVPGDAGRLNRAVLIDYRMPISMRRLWVVDRSSGGVLLNTHARPPRQ